MFTKRTIRFLIWSTAASLLIVIFLNFVANIYLGRWFEKQVREFNIKSQGRYRIEYGRIRAYIPFNRITLNRFRLIPSPRFHQNGGFVGRTVSIELRLLKIKGISIIKAAFSKSIDVRAIVFRNPEIKVFSNTGRPSELSPPLLESRAPSNHSISIPVSIGSIVFRNGSFTSINNRNPESPNRTWNFDFRLRDVKLGVKAGEKYFSIFEPDSLELTARNIRLNFPDNLHALSIEELGFSQTLKKIWLRSATLEPLYPRYAFSERIGHRITRKSIRVNWIHVHDFNPIQWIKRGELNSRLLSARGVDVEFFSNRGLPRRKIPRRRKFLQQWLRELPLKLNIRKAKISKGRIEYLESANGSNQTAGIHFSDISMDIENITNIPSLLSKQSSVLISARSRFMDQTGFHIDMRLMTPDPRDRFWFSGRLGPLQGSVLNPILKNHSLMIEKGFVNSMAFEAQANRFEARGQMKLIYHKLKISLLRKRKMNRRDKLTSFFLNRIIQTNNPRRSKPLRIGDMYFKRDNPKSMFNFMWKSLLAGIKSSIGLKKKKR